MMKKYLFLILSIFVLGAFNAGDAISSGVSKLDEPILPDALVRYFKP